MYMRVRHVSQIPIESYREISLKGCDIYAYF